jgi:hypothetical protein
MHWARILAYVTGTVDRELLARNEYLATENRILKDQLKGRLGVASSLSPLRPSKSKTWTETSEQGLPRRPCWEDLGKTKKSHRGQMADDESVTPPELRPATESVPDPRTCGVT